MKPSSPSPLTRLLERLKNVRHHGITYTALCPAHDDRNPSLSIRLSDRGDVLLHCFAGCPASAIVAACGLSLRDLFASTTEHPPAHRRAYACDRGPIARQKPKSSPAHRRSAPVVATGWACVDRYPYADEVGRLLFTVDRLERLVRVSRTASPNRPSMDDAPTDAPCTDAATDAPSMSDRDYWRREKRFRQWHWGPNGERINNVVGCRMVLYMLPDVRRAVADGSPVVIVEGEKDANTVNLLVREEIGSDFVATTNPGGAGRWRPEYAATLRGAHVILCGDADKAGTEHMVAVGRNIAPVARSLRVVDIRRLLGGRDDGE